MRVGENVILAFGTCFSKAPLISVLKNLVILLVLTHFYFYIQKIHVDSSWKDRSGEYLQYVLT